MKEDFLHYIWQHQYFDKTALATTDGEAVQVLRTGFYNADAGPDFKEALLQVGTVEWSGSVEIHLRASDWFRHQHQHDQKYDQVVLHVVWEADRPVQRADGTLVPTLELKGLVNLALLHTYQQLKQSQHIIPCAPFWPAVNEITKRMMLERALVERLETKGHEVLQVHKASGNDWEQTAYSVLLRGFGFNTNQPAVEQLVKALPLAILRRHRHSLLHLEALLLGQAGFLENAPLDNYVETLQLEYNFLSHKYNLQPDRMQRHQWNFLRMRPANFPSMRLAQLAAMLHAYPALFTSLTEPTTIEQYEALFRVPVSAYWQRHYMLGRVSKTVQTSLGKGSAHNLIINVAVPLLAAYSRFSGDKVYQDKAINLLERVREESNKITRLYGELGWQARNAADNQAALGLFKQYCQPVNCLHCAVGHKILKQNAPAA
ncbi:DUF2851 family protein [Pontibacter liquoris]|uniref:DUF2851 family protein n=1 Tax=Pontibacter liquoris TaxID=2905677 RepID=UPI001FA7C4DB|nr:DUF2851 family protein [Pontibacter liquoris]